jgi:hypothetical protein
VIGMVANGAFNALLYLALFGYGARRYARAKEKARAERMRR